MTTSLDAEVRSAAIAADWKAIFNMGAITNAEAEHCREMLGYISDAPA